MSVFKIKFNTLKKVFPKTIPVMMGYVFLGTTYGIYARTQSLPMFVPMITCFLVFSGAMEFALVNILLGVFDPLTAAIMGLTLGARHIFYGISMIDKYKDSKTYKPYLIYGLTDETFSINCSVAFEDDEDKSSFYFQTSLLDHSYWIIGCYLGAIIGSFITIPATGLDFVMTAMFIVIYVDNLLKEKNHIASIIGLIIPLLFLIILGKDNFIIPSLLTILLILTIIKKPLESILDKRVDGAKHE